MAASAPSSTAASSAPAGKSQKWLPLESNPELMNKYMEAFGFPTAMYKFVDILSTDDWALDMIPKPVVAVVFLYPIKEATEAFRAEEAKRIADEGQEVSGQLFFTKQTVGNACGTIGLLHAVANVADATGGDVPLVEGKFWHNFITKHAAASPDERATALETDEELETQHQTVAADESAAVLETVDVYTHFIALVEKEGALYELDGRKATPINHGPATRETLLAKSMDVMKAFMARDEGEIRFTMLALAANTGDA